MLRDSLNRLQAYIKLLKFMAQPTRRDEVWVTVWKFSDAAKYSTRLALKENHSLSEANILINTNSPMANDNFNETNILNRFNSPPQGRFLSQENIGKVSF